MKTPKTNTGKRLISLLLTAAMLITAYQIPTRAETTQDAIQLADKDREMPSNPVHHCTSKENSMAVEITDITDWSYIYFGSYPQGEVAGDALTASIIEASYDSNGDAWVNNVKYRRISKNDTNYDGCFGDSEYRYFKWEKVKWRVLKNDGNTLFVMSDRGLDCKAYHELGTFSSWEGCTLRKWLNNDFYNMAFSGDEQGAVIEQTLSNGGTGAYQNDTKDKVFLIGAESHLSNYGFCSVDGGSAASASRWVEASDYAYTMGVQTSIYNKKNCGWWWLRLKKNYLYDTAVVDSSGGIYNNDGANDKRYACVPALHINLSSDLWSLVGDGSSGEDGGSDDTGEIRNQNIIDRVSEYTSDELYAQYDKITNSNYSHDTKNKMYQSLFQSYGITDVREGIRYLSNTTNKRYAYLAMTTDDLYCASNFKYWLKNTAKGKAAQAVLLADGLIFNGEINDWLDFSTYLETDYPGVAKYKAMLYDFMDASSDSIEIVSNIKLVSDMASKTTGAAKLKADNLIEQLNHCSTAAEAERIMNSRAAMEVWTELAKAKDETGNFVRDNNGSIELTYKLDESSGFGQFSKAMGQAAKGISIADMALSDVKDLLTLDSKLAVYAQYRRFLQDIVSDTDGLPFQMRWAAALILTELEENYYAKIKDIVWEIINQTSINSAVLKQIIGETAAGSLSSWLNVIGIEAFFINKIADIGEMVKKESAVEGYASLSSAFTKKLERSKQAFLANKTESNAWDFYYNYNILYRLRYKGEKAYLSMTKIKGFLSCFSDFGYAEKEAVVNDTLQMLESRCQFTLDAAQPIPESCQFASKSVINCPVNVSVYAEDGTLISELLDGVESDVTNEYGRFAVVYDAYSGDYEKVICLNSEENVSFKITGTDDGLVTMDFTQAKDEESNIYTFDSVPIDKDAVINTTVQEITEQNAYGVDTDADGEIDEQGTITVKPETYVPVESVELSETALELNTGESSVLRVAVTPINATNQKVLWMSADPSIAAVTDGKVTAIADGNTTIYCMILDNMDKMISCEVNVSSNMECTHQNTEVRNQLAATCGDEGYTGDIYCKDCNAKIETGQVIAVTAEHTWNNGEEIKFSTCTEKGEVKYTCTVCGATKTDETETRGHQSTEVRNQLAATCGAEGYTGDTYCKDCNVKMETGQVIAATGEHIWNDGEEIKTPTCKEKGEKNFLVPYVEKRKKKKLKN